MRPAEQRLLAQLALGAGTTIQLADRAGVDRTYAREVLYGLMQRGTVRRWKRPGTRARIWELA